MDERLDATASQSKKAQIEGWVRETLQEMELQFEKKITDLQKTFNNRIDAQRTDSLPAITGPFAQLIATRGPVGGWKKEIV